MIYNKITYGFVVQTFNDKGEPLGQSFIAGDEGEFETGDGNPIDVGDMPLCGAEYQTFDMIQPLDHSSGLCPQRNGG